MIGRILERYAGRSASRVLDVGCGGAWTLFDLRGSLRVHGLDRLSPGLRRAREAGIPEVVQADCGSVPYRSGVFDAVLMFDLLEHVDDGEALNEGVRVVRPGGVVMATCPAGPWLWSERDRAAGHRRRYTAKGVRTLFERRGLKVLAIRRYQFLLFPLFVAARWVGRRNPSVLSWEERPGRRLNRVLTRINRIDARLGARLRWPWGTSLVVVGRKT